MSRIFSSAEPGPQLTWTAMIKNVILCPGKLFMFRLPIVEKLIGTRRVFVDQKRHVLRSSHFVVVYRTGDKSPSCRAWHFNYSLSA